MCEGVGTGVRGVLEGACMISRSKENMRMGLEVYRFIGAKVFGFIGLWVCRSFYYRRSIARKRKRRVCWTSSAVPQRTLGW